MGMFKPKKKAQPLPVESEEVEEEIIEDEEESEDPEVEEKVEEAPVRPVKKIIKTKVQPNKPQIGDILTVQQTVGYHVIKDFDEEGQPLVTPTDKLSEAEILSFIYKQ